MNFCLKCTFNYDILQYWFFKVYDSDAVSADDLIGTLLVEVDPFATARATKKTKLAEQTDDSKATLTITPA